jgi:cytochrome P450
MLMDFMLAGSDTTANTLGFALAEMINHPDVAERVYEEVQSVCGSTTPSVEHLNSLVFTEAVINEILRFHTIAPNGLPHRVVEPIEISGYQIPVNARVPSSSHTQTTILTTFFSILGHLTRQYLVAAPQ